MMVKVKPAEQLKLTIMPLKDQPMEQLDSKLKSKKNDYYKVLRKDIIVKEEFNARIDYGDIEELARVIENNGIPGHLTGKRKKSDNSEFEYEFELSDGFRRMRAIDLLIAKGYDVGLIPINREPQGYTVEDRYFDMFNKNRTKHLIPLEEGELFKKLKAKGYTILAISKRIGKSDEYVSNMIQVASTPQAVKNEILEGNISANLVTKIVKAVDTEEELLEAVKESKVTASKKGKKKVTEEDVEKLVEKKKKLNPVLKKFNILTEMIKERKEHINGLKIIDNKSEKIESIEILSKIFKELSDCLNSSNSAENVLDNMLKIIKIEPKLFKLSGGGN
jgi:ParB/RepB/Spo0J family partition protein